jgi:hypothetical protein
MAKVVKDIDRGWKKFKRMFRRTKGPAAHVGIQGRDAEAPKKKGDVTNVLVASVHEFGSPKSGIPERSFLRSSFDENLRDYDRSMKKAAKRVMTSQQLRGEFRLIGEEYRADVIEKIKSNIPPPLAPETQERKARDGAPDKQALVDTGQLLNSIDVEMKGPK